MFAILAKTTHAKTDPKYSVCPKKIGDSELIHFRHKLFTQVSPYALLLIYYLSTFQQIDTAQEANRHDVMKSVRIEYDPLHKGSINGTIYLIPPMQIRFTHALLQNLSYITTQSLPKQLLSSLNYSQCTTPASCTSLQLMAKMTIIRLYLSQSYAMP